MNAQPEQAPDAAAQAESEQAQQRQEVKLLQRSFRPRRNKKSSDHQLSAAKVQARLDARAAEIKRSAVVDLTAKDASPAAKRRARLAAERAEIDRKYREELAKVGRR